ncbi:MAG: hypothetical protein JW726_06030, partial [Anaerolineales bacterium]|nr:hypothetical protein [Anaerolineales bacterium]
MNRWTEVVRSNEKLSMLISYGLTAALVVCFTIGVVQVGERIVPDWNGGYLPWFCLLVALEALYSQRQMRRSVDIQTGTVVYRAVEWVVMLVLLKLVIYLVNGFQRLWADLSFSQDNFIDGFFTPEYFLAILLVAFVWGLSLMFGEDLMELEGDS